MGADRIFNRAKVRRLKSSHKAYCNNGHWPITFPGGHCPLCFENRVNRSLTEMVVELSATVERCPNRVGRAGL